MPINDMILYYSSKNQFKAVKQINFQNFQFINFNLMYTYQSEKFKNVNYKMSENYLGKT